MADIGYPPRLFDPGYDRIFDEIKIRIDLLTTRYLPESKNLIDKSVYQR